MERQLAYRNSIRKSPSKQMLSDLQKAREIELSRTGRNICKICDFKGTIPGLYQLRFIDIKMVSLDNEEILCVYVTKWGINFLNDYKEESKPYKKIQWFPLMHYILRLTHITKLAR